MKILHFVPILLLSGCLYSCNNGEIKTLNEKIDSLVKANVKLQKELDIYKYSPAKLLAEIRQNYTDKQYSSINKNFDMLKRYHPESSEFEEAKKIKEQAIKDQEAARKKEEAEKRAKMTPIERIMEKYACDEDIAALIIKKKVAIGMTAEQCRAAWGRPQDINRTSASYGVHEQWVYDGHDYLYFENGILTTIQN